MCVKSLYLGCYMFDFSARKGNNACVRAHTLCVCVVQSEGVCAVCMFRKKKKKKTRGGKEMKLDAVWIMEYVLLSAVCSSERLSEWNSCEKLQCVLGVVSGTAWIACGCLPGLIPLNSTISFHSLSTKKKHVPQLRCTCTGFTITFSRGNKTARRGSQILGFVRAYCAVVEGKWALSYSVRLFSLWRASCWDPYYCPCITLSSKTIMSHHVHCAVYFTVRCVHALHRQNELTFSGVAEFSLKEKTEFLTKNLFSYWHENASSNRLVCLW